MKRPFAIVSRVPVRRLDVQADEFVALREEMVQSQIAERGIKDERVLAAMRRVPRHLFIPSSKREVAYEDHPLPIGEGQTISQPYIVAYMTEALQLPSEANVLEVGTGSAYQTAVLAEVAARVYSMEILRKLAERARVLLTDLGYENVETASRDGYEGWPEHAPFDGIMVTAAAARVPEQLLKQLKPGARLIMPLGSAPMQYLTVFTRERDDWREEQVLPVCFVPMTGLAQQDALGD